MQRREGAKEFIAVHLKKDLANAVDPFTHFLFPFRGGGL
jgi:hypothetical protein